MRAQLRYLLPLVAVALPFAGCSDSSVPVTPTPTKVAPPSLATRALRQDGYIVVLKPGAAAFASVSRARPGSRPTGALRLASLTIPMESVGDAVPSINAVVVRNVDPSTLLADNDVESVVPNYDADIIDPLPMADAVVTYDGASSTPSGTDQSGAFFFANGFQWSFKKMSANRVWVPSRGGQGARVCIVDSGIDAGHLDFAGKTITSTSFLASSAAQTDTLGHGSHVAGIISTNGIGGASVVPNATLMTAKIFNGAGGGGSASNIINGVQWCTDNGADVINMSLGFTGGIPITGNEAFIAAFQAGLDYATNNGVLLVAAAGNDGATLPVAGSIFLPAEANGVTSVAATGPNANLTPFGTPIWITPGAQFDGIASYSNRGPVPSVDISAPGGDFDNGWPSQSLIMSVCSSQFKSGSTFPCAGGNSYLFEAGTSMASPHVAGVAALIRARFPSSARSTALRSKIESCLYRSVDNIGPSNIFGRGRLNAFKAATSPC